MRFCIRLGESRRRLLLLTPAAPLPASPWRLNPVRVRRGLDVTFSSLGFPRMHDVMMRLLDRLSVAGWV
jgi:hypothetical protein